MRQSKVKQLPNVFGKPIYEVSEMVVRTIKDSNWVQGVFAGYRFEAKIFVEPSDYGIDGGRVSKLWMQRGVNYDRGWDVGQTKRRVWGPLVKQLEAFAQSEAFKSHVGYGQKGQ